MRHSLHTEHEILSLLCEADAGVSIAEICSTAGVSLRTFYRWRKRYGGLTNAALLRLKELEFENRRLRSLVSKLADREQQVQPEGNAVRDQQPPRQDLARGLGSAIGARRGLSLGRYASVRGLR